MMHGVGVGGIDGVKGAPLERAWRLAFGLAPGSHDKINGLGMKVNAGMGGRGRKGMTGAW